MAIPTAARHAPTGKDGKRETGAAAITAKPVASAVTRRLQLVLSSLQRILGFNSTRIRLNYIHQ